MRLRYLPQVTRLQELPKHADRWVSFPPGLVDIDSFPRLESSCDPRPVEMHPSGDGRWRFTSFDRGGR